jgi:SAM-dependent methyltransferase
MLKALAHTLARYPLIFDGLRWFLEAGYIGEKRVLRQEALSGKGSVLDVGCGTGALAAWFAPERYTGIDVSEAYIARARHKWPAYAFQVMDATALAFEDALFDAALISGVLHHLPDEQCTAVIREVARVLRADGTLVLWEDVRARSRWNLLGALVHRFDEGADIRTDAAYRALVEPAFAIVRAYPMSSGVCDYAVVVGAKR